MVEAFNNFVNEKWRLTRDGAIAICILTTRRRATQAPHTPSPLPFAILPLSTHSHHTFLAYVVDAIYRSCIINISQNKNYFNKKKTVHVLTDAN